MKEYTNIMINKNRGWRGLAKAEIYNKSTKDRMEMVFSFSPEVWRDMLAGYMVFQDKDYFYIVEFDNTFSGLPKAHQQRSVLIKNFVSNILGITPIEKTNWMDSKYPYSQRLLITHARDNSNNHTHSAWNNIGIRVIPEI